MARDCLPLHLRWTASPQEADVHSTAAQRCPTIVAILEDEKVTPGAARVAPVFIWDSSPKNRQKASKKSPQDKKSHWFRHATNNKYGVCKTWMGFQQH